MEENRGMEGVVIQGLDVLDVLKFVDKKKQRFLAISLNDLEEIYEARGIDKNSEEFQLIRKLILDLVNEYTRSVLRVIFGDIEYLRYEDPNKR